MARKSSLINEAMHVVMLRPAPRLAEHFMRATLTLSAKPLQNVNDCTSEDVKLCLSCSGHLPEPSDS